MADSKRSAARRTAVIARLNQTTARVEAALRSKQVPFWRWVREKVDRHFDVSSSVTPDVDDLFQLAEFERPFNDALTPGWRQAIEVGAEFERQWIGQQEVEQHVGAMLTQAAPLPMSEAMAKDVAAWLAARRVGVWRLVGETVRARLAKALADGLKAGDSRADLEARVKAVLASHSAAAIARIARTETTGALGFGHYKERESLGVANKEWVSIIDSHTRVGSYDHVKPDGQVVANTDVFIVSGEQLLFPGDTSYGATAGNILQCRCRALGETGRKPATRTLPVPDDEVRGITERAIREAYDEVVSREARERADRLLDRLAEREAELDAIRRRVADLDHKLPVLEADEDAARSRVFGIKRLLLLALLTGRKDDAAKLDDELDEANDLWAAAALAVANERRRQRMEAAKIIRGDVAPLRVKLVVGAGVQDDAARAAMDATEFLAELIAPAGAGAAKVEWRVRPANDGRAFTLMVAGAVGLPRFADPLQAVHQLAHLLENNPAVADLAKAYLHIRSRIALPQALHTLWPGRWFSPDEVAWRTTMPHTFANYLAGWYAAKWYRRQTELVAAGSELLYHDPVALAKRDPGFFVFLIGVLSGRLL